MRLNQWLSQGSRYAMKLEAKIKQWMYRQEDSWNESQWQG